MLNTVVRSVETKNVGWGVGVDSGKLGLGVLPARSGKKPTDARPELVMEIPYGAGRTSRLQIMYVRSYGEKWEGSVAELRASVSLAGTAGGK